SVTRRPDCHSPPGARGQRADCGERALCRLSGASLGEPDRFGAGRAATIDLLQCRRPGEEGGRGVAPPHLLDLDTVKPLGVLHAVWLADRFSPLRDHLAYPVADLAAMSQQRFYLGFKCLRDVDKVVRMARACHPELTYGVGLQALCQQLRESHAV